MTEPARGRLDMTNLMLVSFLLLPLLGTVAYVIAAIAQVS